MELTSEKSNNCDLNSINYANHDGIDADDPYINSKLYSSIADNERNKVKWVYKYPRFIFRKW